MASSTNSHAQAHMGDGDQTGHSQGNIAHSTNEFQAAPHLSHKLPDPKDERTVDNRVEAEKLQEKMENIQDAASAREQRHPTTRAQDHGNEPSKGAKVDEELAAEDEARINQKKAEGKSA